MDVGGAPGLPRGAAAVRIVVWCYCRCHALELNHSTNPFQPHPNPPTNRYGKSWKDIQSLVKTRTSDQIRTHAQKHFIKLAKKTAATSSSKGGSSGSSSGSNNGGAGKGKSSGSSSGSSKNTVLPPPPPAVVVAAAPHRDTDEFAPLPPLSPPVAALRV